MPVPRRLLAALALLVAAHRAQDGWRRLTAHAAEDFHPAWSPDGALVLFGSQRDGHGEVYRMRSDGAELQRLTRDGVPSDHPRWFPDGRRLLFVCGEDAAADPCVLACEGGTPRRLAANGARETVPVWPRDGRRVLFVSARDGNLGYDAPSAP